VSCAPVNQRRDACVYFPDVSSDSVAMSDMRISPQAHPASAACSYVCRYQDRTCRCAHRRCLSHRDSECLGV
jgi:hypothetical protein